MKRLKELRLEKRWTKNYLGSLLNVKSDTISQYESGRSPLEDEIIIRIAKLFNVTTDYLLGLTITREDILSEDEKKVLRYFNRLNDEDKDSVKGYMVDIYRMSSSYEEAHKKRAA